VFVNKSGKTLSVDDVLHCLTVLSLVEGVTEHFRSDNGPVHCYRMRNRLGRFGTKTSCKEPGSPWESGSVESFNGKLRDELIRR